MHHCPMLIIALGRDRDAMRCPAGHRMRQARQSAVSLLRQWC